MSAQRAEQPTESDEERKRAGREALAEFRRLQDKLRAANPDMTEEDWDTLADEWAEAVNEGLREHVRRHNEEWERRQR